MKAFVSISKVGSVRILDIPLCASVDYVKNALHAYNLQENDTCLYLKNFSIDDLPNLDIHFNKNRENTIDRIYIGNSQLTKGECLKVYTFFQKELAALNVFSKKEDEIILLNALHRITIGKQVGLNSDANKFPFYMHIQGRLLGNNEEQLKYGMRQLYLDEERTEEVKCNMVSNVHSRKNNIYNIMRLLLCIIALVIAYLFALNGRYIKDGDYCYFDKWTKTMLWIDRGEVVK